MNKGEFVVQQSFGRIGENDTKRQRRVEKTQSDQQRRVCGS